MLKKKRFVFALLCVLAFTICVGNALAETLYRYDFVGEGFVEITFYEEASPVDGYVVYSERDGHSVATISGDAEWYCVFGQFEEDEREDWLFYEYDGAGQIEILSNDEQEGISVTVEPSEFYDFIVTVTIEGEASWYCSFEGSALPVIDEDDEYYDEDDVYDEDGMLFEYPYDYEIISDGQAQLVYYDEPEDASICVIPSEVKGYTVVSIAEDVFWWCEFEELVLPETLVEIAADAMYGCEELEKINIPNSLIALEGNPFPSCPGLKTIMISEDHPAFRQENGVLFSSDGKRLLYYPIHLTATEYTVPQGVIEIASSAFCENLYLQTVHFPSSLQKIGREAFYGCEALEKAELPLGLKELGFDAFASCSILKEIFIPETVEAIEANPFSDCAALKTVNVHEDNPFFLSDDGVLYSCDRQSLICYPAGKGEAAFSIPKGTINVLEDAFYSAASLVEVSIPNTVAYIGNAAFSYCSGLTDVVIPESVREMGYLAFYYCEALERVIIEEGLEELGGSLFSGCYKLAYIEIPQSVVRIDERAFEHNEGLVIQAPPGSYAEEYAKELVRRADTPIDISGWGE